MKKLTTIIFLFALSLAMTACPGGGNSGDPNAGFKLSTFAYSPINTGVYVPTAGNVQGFFLSGSGATTGTVTSFNQDFSGVGLLAIPGAKVPGLWRFRLARDLVLGSLCLQPTITDLNMRLNSEEVLFCPGLFVGFTALPESINALSPPATMIFSGKGLSNTYGEPALAFYNEFGNVVASTQASQSLWNGDEIEGIVVSVPDISQVYDGVYTITVNNIRPDGIWELIGAAQVTIYGNPPPPPPPPPGGGCEPPQPPDLEQLPCQQG